GRGRAPVITGDAFDVDVEVDPNVPADAFEELLSWFHGRLAAGSDGTPAPVLAPRAIGPTLLRGRQRVTVLAKQVESDFAVRGWRVEPLRWPADARAVLAVRGPGSAGVEIRFTIGARGRRSTVGIEFAPADSSGDHTPKAVMEALLAILRQSPARPASPEEAAALPT